MMNINALRPLDGVGKKALRRDLRMPDERGRHGDRDLHPSSRRAIAIRSGSRRRT